MVDDRIRQEMKETRHAAIKAHQTTISDECIRTLVAEVEIELGVR